MTTRTTGRRATTSTCCSRSICTTCRIQAFGTTTSYHRNLDVKMTCWQPWWVTGSRLGLFEPPVGTGVLTPDILIKHSILIHLFVCFVLLFYIPFVQCTLDIILNIYLLEPKGGRLSHAICLSDIRTVDFRATPPLPPPPPCHNKNNMGVEGGGLTRNTLDKMLNIYLLEPKGVQNFYPSHKAFHWNIPQ